MINQIRIRFFLFLFGCIGSRLALTVVSAFASGWFLALFGIIVEGLAIPAVRVVALGTIAGREVI